MYYTTRTDEVMAHIAEHRLSYPAVRLYASSMIAFQAGGWSRDPFTRYHCCLPGRYQVDSSGTANICG